MSPGRPYSTEPLHKRIVSATRIRVSPFMGDKPCQIVPVPKRMELAPGARPWPKQINVCGRTPTAAPFRDRYHAELPGNGDAELSVTLAEAQCNAEGYELQFADDSLTVSAGDAAGFRHALQTLRQIASEGSVPTGKITDYPALSVRGFHLNFESYRRLDVDEALRLIDVAARFKLNTLLVEYGPRFPFESHPEIRRAALSPEDIERLNAAAAEHGIRIIPLQQSLAHLEYALGHKPLAALRERPEKPNLMCPADPDSLALFKTLAADIIRLHPKAHWFHLGGDEARKFGHCPRCANAVKQDGRGAVYGRYIGQAARWLLDQGLRPIIWDDTLCAHPDAIEYLPKEAVIDYWDYIAVADPTPVIIPRMSHAAGGPRVAHDWAWTLRRKNGRIGDMQTQIMRNYSKPARLKSALGAKYLEEFGSYLGDGFPTWIRALPYIEYYQDRGHDVITSPTGMGNGDTKNGIPNFQRFEHNIAMHAQRGKSNGRTLGMITTAWYNMPPDLLYQPLIRTAQCAW